MLEIQERFVWLKKVVCHLVTRMVTSLYGSTKVPNWSKITASAEIKPRTIHFQSPTKRLKKEGPSTSQHPAKTNKLLVNSGQANNFGVTSSTTQQKWHPNNKVQTSLFFLRTYWSSFLWSWSRYLFLRGKQAPGTKSVTEINLKNSAWSSIQHLLLRNAMDITTLHKSFQTKTHLFYSTTKWRCGNMSFTEWYNKQSRMSIHPSFVIHVFKQSFVMEYHFYSDHLNTLQSPPSSDNVSGIFLGGIHSLLFQKVLLYESYRFLVISKTNMQNNVQSSKNLISYLNCQKVHIIIKDDIKKTTSKKTTGININMPLKQTLQVFSFTII